MVSSISLIADFLMLPRAVLDTMVIMGGVIMGVKSARVKGEANGAQTKKSYDIIYA